MSQSDGGQGRAVHGALCCLLWSSAQGTEVDAVSASWEGAPTCASLLWVPAPPVPFLAHSFTQGQQRGLFFFLF